MNASSMNHIRKASAKGFNALISQTCRNWSTGSFSVHPEIASAVDAGHPVVALETTILTHGMPHPQNIETALEVEGVVRNQGAVPASIGLLDGTVHVGLTEPQLEVLAVSSPVSKVSRQDLAYCISEGYSGGTTVAGTMVCAHKAGIPIFVTGGIGGVHRGGQDSLDISADLTELGRTPVSVVCAGIKSILDIGRTLEYLETQGVPVVSVGGQDKMFPSFFTAENASLEFGVRSGLLFGVPIPHEAKGEELEAAIQEALEEARIEGITGKKTTPFILSRVNELTSGRSLRANIELIKNNARVGGQIAVELSKLRQNYRGGGGGGGARLQGESKTGLLGEFKSGLPGISNKSRLPGISKSRLQGCKPRLQGCKPRLQGCKSGEGEGDLVVVGASILDFSAKILTPNIMSEGTNKGSLIASCGGVGRNIAEGISRLRSPPLFISAVGNDQNGKIICEDLIKSGMSLSGLRRSDELRTATYCLVLDHKGELYCGIGDMDIIELISVEWIKSFSDEIKRAACVCVDANIPWDTLEFILQLCSSEGVPVWFEPTCVSKAHAPFHLHCSDKIAFTSPNLLELRTMYHALTSKETATIHPSELSLSEKLLECEEMVRPLLAHIPTIAVSLGRDGVLYCSKEEDAAEIECLHYPAASMDKLPVSVLSVSGAGDSFVSSMLSGLCGGLSPDSAVKAGLHAAYLSLGSMTPISHKLNPQLLEEEHIKEWAPWNPTKIIQGPPKYWP